MALNLSPIPQFTTPVPSRADRANFNTRADLFVTELTAFVTALNDAITELNLITSGLDQTAPIAAYAAGTTYDFPDCVACTDGQTYRCIDTGVIGVNPMTDTTHKWVKVGVSIIDKLVDLGTVGSTVTLDTVNYDTFVLTCNTPVLDFSSTSIAVGRTINLVITDGGDRNFYWPAGTVWPEGELPIFSIAGTDRIVMQRISAVFIHANMAGESYA